MPENECVDMFLRLQRTCGFYENGGNNSISYEDFKEGYFFACYDLTSSSTAYEPDLIPSPRVGPLKIEITFSGSIPYELKLISLLEFPSVASLSSNGDCSLSYTQ